MLAYNRLQALCRIQARLRSWYVVEAQDRSTILPGYFTSLLRLERSSGAYKRF